VQRYARIIRLDYDGQVGIRGHMSSQKLDVAKVASALPLRAEDIELRVLIASAFTSTLRELALRDYEVSGQRVRELLAWLRVNNCLYADIELDAGALLHLPVRGVLAGIIHNAESAEEERRKKSSVAVEPEAERGSQFGATVQIPSRADSYQNTAIALRSIRVIENKQQRTYSVRSSSEQHWDSDDKWFTASHPLQLPFGRGGPNEKRKPRVSAKACFEHYCRLSTRKFQGSKDALAMYDSCARAAVAREVCVQASWRTMNAPDNSPFGVLSVHDLEAAIAHNESMAAAIRDGRRLPDVPADLSSDAKRFIETVKICTHSAEHTVEHALRARINILSMGYAMGPATWWYVCIR
jgi:hypothetical protein